MAVVIAKGTSAKKIYLYVEAEFLKMMLAPQGAGEMGLYKAITYRSFAHIVRDNARPVRLCCWPQLRFVVDWQRLAEY